MNKKNKALIIGAILGMVLMANLSIKSYPRFHGNFGECTVEPGCEGVDGSSTGVYIPESSGILKIYIIDGAGYVLNTYSHLGTFLRLIEMSELNGPDYGKMRETLYSMIEDMERARDTYYIVHSLMQSTPYKQSVIERLKAFDYDGFRETSGLSSVVFERVKEYLECGDVRGVYAAVHKNTGNILDQLYVLKDILEADKLPHISQVWRLNQTFTETVLFGSYFSQVMYQSLIAPDK